MLGLGIALAAAILGSSSASPVKWVPLNSAQQTKSRPKVRSALPSAAPAATQEPAEGAKPAAIEVAPQAAPATVAAPGIDHPLAISCFGGGTADKSKVVSSYGNSSFSGLVGAAVVSGNGSGSSWTVVPRDRQFSEQVDVRLFSGDDRIRLPRTMLPGIHGGDHGWFKLRSVVADARSIGASAAVNLLNNPKIFIDRVTGTISISGKSGDFSGQCEVVDANATAKF